MIKNARESLDPEFKRINISPDIIISRIVAVSTQKALGIDFDFAMSSNTPNVHTNRYLRITSDGENRYLDYKLDDPAIFHSLPPVRVNKGEDRDMVFSHIMDMLFNKLNEQEAEPQPPKMDDFVFLIPSGITRMSSLYLVNPNELLTWEAIYGYLHHCHEEFSSYRSFLAEQTVALQEGEDREVVRRRLHEREEPLFRVDAMMLFSFLQEIERRNTKGFITHS